MTIKTISKIEMSRDDIEALNHAAALLDDICELMAHTESMLFLDGDIGGFSSDEVDAASTILTGIVENATLRAEE